jgi:biotin carboxylase
MTHRVMSDNGVPCARQRTARDLPGIIRAVREIGPPCVLKPQYGSGSKGVVVIRTEEEAEDLARLHLEHRAGDEDSLVEELLGGEEYGIDGVVIDGRFRLILARKKIITRYPYRQELGYLAPDEPADGRFAVIGGMMQAAVAAAGLDHCLVNADVLVDGDKAWLIEITGRPAGQMTTEFMVPFVTGVDPIVEFIRHQNGMDGDFAVKQARPMVFHFLAVPPGRVVSVPDREAIVRNPNVLRYASDITPGDVLAEIRNGVDAYARGYVATTGESVGHALREAVAVIHQFGVAQGG